MKRTNRGQHKQLYINKSDNLDETDKFTERQKLLKLIQGEIDNINRPIAIKEIGLITSNLLKQKAPDPCGFTGELYQTFNK